MSRRAGSLNYTNTDRLKSWLLESSFDAIAHAQTFILDSDDFGAHYGEVMRQHPDMDQPSASDRAAFRCLTNGKDNYRNQKRVDVETKTNNLTLQHTQLLALQLDRHREQREYEANLSRSLCAAIDSSGRDILLQAENHNVSLRSENRQSHAHVQEYLDRIHGEVTDGQAKTVQAIYIINGRQATLETAIDLVAANQSVTRRILIVGIVILALLLSGNLAFGAGMAIQQIVIPCVANAAAPTLTEAQRAPCSTDLAGALRVGGTVTATVSTSGLATSANQTNGTQQTRVVDAAGDTALVTAGGLLQVDGSGVTQPISGNVGVTGVVTIDTSNLSTSALQTTGNTSLATIAGTVAGTEIQADIVAALPAGTNNIGDVDVLTFPDNEPFNVAQVNGSTVTAGAGAVTAGTQRVTLASDDPAVTSLGVLDNTVSGSELQVDVITMPTTTVTGTVTVTQATSASLLSMVFDDHCDRSAMARGATTFTTATSSSVVAAGGSNIKNYVYSAQVVNTGSTNVLITWRDGSGGSALGYTTAPATFGGSNIVFEVPLVTSNNTALFAETSAGSTTVYVSAQACRGS